MWPTRRPRLRAPLCRSPLCCSPTKSIRDEWDITSHAWRSPSFVELHGAAGVDALPASDATLHASEFDALLAKAQTPDAVDDVEKIRRDLDETQETLHTTIKDLLARGEKLDDLADQSEDLGVFSREFLKKSESMNACCLLL
eukprot:TRINITY_DN927_c0_g1_i4.p3 TRINITY_DN927_c0_g1~~TRINITY_DN927_c0_g1_i4.p3  ORF type:complete len:142 (-),score=58.97 TRINITY_DN927_c0_g1_i4:47-472(-)